MVERRERGEVNVCACDIMQGRYGEAEAIVKFSVEANARASMLEASSLSVS